MFRHCCPSKLFSTVAEWNLNFWSFSLISVNSDMNNAGLWSQHLPVFECVAPGKHTKLEFVARDVWHSHRSIHSSWSYMKLNPQKRYYMVKYFYIWSRFKIYWFTYSNLRNCWKYSFRTFIFILIVFF